MHYSSPICNEGRGITFRWWLSLSFIPQRYSKLRVRAPSRERLTVHGRSKEHFLSDQLPGRSGDRTKLCTTYGRNQFVTWIP